MPLATVKVAAVGRGKCNPSPCATALAYLVLVDAEEVGGVHRGPVEKHRENAVLSRGNAAARVGGIKFNV